jgi:hypothetical protein
MAFCAARAFGQQVTAPESKISSGMFKIIMLHAFALLQLWQMEP